MGLFNRKKKEQSAQNADLFAKYNRQMNDVKPAESMKRKDAAAAAATNRVNETKRENVYEKLSQLRVNLMRNDGFDTLVDRVGDMMHKLNQRDAVTNANTAAVDALLLASIENALDYCYDGSYVAVQACLGIIDGYIRDRANAKSYYGDRDYLEAILEKDRIYVEIQKEKADYRKLEKEMEQLKLDSKNPALGLTTRDVADRAAEIREEGQEIQGRISEYENAVKVQNKIIDTFKVRDVKTSTGYNKTDAVNTALEAKRENEYDSSTNDKLLEDLSRSRKRVRGSTLMVNDDAMDNVAAKPAELSDDMFKM